MNSLIERIQTYEISDILEVLRERYKNADCRDEEEFRLFMIIDMALEASKNYDIAKNNKQLSDKAFNGWFAEPMQIFNNLTIRKY